jgi:hypothetical protein
MFQTWTYGLRLSRAAANPPLAGGVELATKGGNTPVPSTLVGVGLALLGWLRLGGVMSGKPNGHWPMMSCVSCTFDWLKS